MAARPAWLLLSAAAARGYTPYAGDLSDPLFSQSRATCVTRATTQLNYSEGFTIYNNLGGVGPETSHYRAIRHASVARSRQSVMSAGAGDTLYAFFCGALQNLAFAARWQDGSLRSCA